MTSANRDDFTSDLDAFSFFSFFPFSCLIALVSTSTTVLNNSGKSGNLCLVPDLKSFQLFTIEYDVSCGLSYMAFITLRYTPSVPSSLRVFIMKGCWNL